MENVYAHTLTTLLNKSILEPFGECAPFSRVPKMRQTAATPRGFLRFL